jgi:hypothetical protein
VHFLLMNMNGFFGCNDLYCLGKTLQHVYVFTSSVL